MLLLERCVMPVSSEMFRQLSNIYRSYSGSSDQVEYIKKNRKIIRVLVDSLWEQIVVNLFSMQPRNYTDARSILNTRLNQLTHSEDVAVAQAMLDVLKEYDALIEKSYIDLTNRIKPILVVSLRRLCFSLTQHRDHKAYGYAITLQGLLP